MPKENEKKIEVSRIVIRIGEKEASLTVDQARELKEILSDLLGEKVVERVIEHDCHDHWIYPHVVPIYYQTPTIPNDGFWKVTCGTNSTYQISMS